MHVSLICLTKQTNRTAENTEVTYEVSAKNCVKMCATNTIKVFKEQKLQSTTLKTKHAIIH